MNEDVLDQDNKPKVSRYKKIMHISYRLIVAFVCLMLVLNLIYPSFIENWLLFYLIGGLAVLWIVLEFIRRVLEK